MNRFDLFISHSSADAAVARALRTELEAAGYACWMAPDDVVGTEPWAEQILLAIGQCRAMVVIVSSHANASAHVSREVELANNRGRAVVPIRIEPVRLHGALEYHLTGLQRVDAFPPPIGDHRDVVVRRVTQVARPGSRTINRAATAAGAAAASRHDDRVEYPAMAAQSGHEDPQAGRHQSFMAAVTQTKPRIREGPTVIIPPSGSRSMRWLAFASRGSAGSLVAAIAVGALGLNMFGPGIEPGATGPTASVVAIQSRPPASGPRTPPPLLPGPTRPASTPRVSARPIPTPRPTPPSGPTKPARITNHADGGTVRGRSATFKWTAGTGSTTVRFYGVYVASTPPAQWCSSGYCQQPPDDPQASQDIDAALGLPPTQLSAKVTNLPADGSTIYVRLFTKYNPDSGLYTWRDYAFTSAP